MEVDRAAAESFVTWLLAQAVGEARGDGIQRLTVAPTGRFWLGRLAPEIVVQNSRLGERSERLEPCEIGVRVRPTERTPARIRCRARMVAWKQISDSRDPDVDKWAKTDRVDLEVFVAAPTSIGSVNAAGRHDIEAAWTRLGAPGLSAEIHAELEAGKQGTELVVTLVNVSPEEIDGLDTNFYEAELEVDILATESFVLDSLPESFRYERRVPAYGINGGVQVVSPTRFVTTDYSSFDQRRPAYWDDEFAGPQCDLSFDTLGENPSAALESLVSALGRWGDQLWAEASLDERARRDNWDASMRTHALAEAENFRRERERVGHGLELLSMDALLQRAFKLANRSFSRAPAVRHTSWRPFQIGFFLANVPAILGDTREEERAFVDTLWFATGGGKTETYLLFVLTAAFYDRLTGKHEGVTSWGRFPLRMLSLQQTQRFVDVFAGAELVRKEQGIGGAPFSVGFLVGEPGTPNRIEEDPRPGKPDPDDPDMPGRYRVLIRCPFCCSEEIEMRFDKSRWMLDHVCRKPGCTWGGKPFPFRIVDEEIYRTLPTIVLGTLDKAAGVAFQAAMRGLYGAPAGRCPKAGHGFTYAPRSKTPTGCLFPGCDAVPDPLNQDASMYAPTIRMQDELHLLRDSLGAVDAHYEAVLDNLQAHWGSGAKIIASSATLAGHREQVQVLYRREGRIFPLPGPRAGHSFWSRESGHLARRYVGLAPRGVTLEYATDQLTESLQRAVRWALDTPDQFARQTGLSAAIAPDLAWLYGVDVVYGSTLKDVEAVARSFESQLRLTRLNAATLTGRTPLEEVRQTLHRLTTPELAFYDRIHLVAASSMLSHGVDIDRLNVMVMLGVPLSTAEFIQTTARVGRAHPGLVVLLHKIGRERDAAVFRTFSSFVQHADRLLDPIPITAKSRRVLELTFSGIEQARVYGMHEPRALAAGLRPLTVPLALRRAFAQLPVQEATELAALIEALGIDGPLDENLRQDLARYVRDFFRTLNDPASTAQWVSDLFSTGEPMLSLRDVEEQAPVYSRGGQA